MSKTVVLIDIIRYLDYVTETPSLPGLCEDYKIIFCLTVMFFVYVEGSHLLPCFSVCVCE